MFEIDTNMSGERRQQLMLIQQVAAQAVREAIRRHMLLGESIAVADESGTGVRILSPDEIREMLEAA